MPSQVFIVSNSPRFALVWLLPLLACGLLSAQHNNRSGRDLQFRFSNPGARSLGFGGAFIGLADDATAPLANPAGSVRTAKRSASFELNYNSVDNNIPFAGGEVLQTNIFEFEFNLEQKTVPEETFQIPYLAMVFPKDKWRYGFFLHQQANLRRVYENDSVFFCHLNSNFYPECRDADNPEFFPPSSEFMELKILNVGGSLAYAFNDAFSLGLSLFYSDFSYQADSVQVNTQIAGDAVVSRTARGDDTSWGGIAGMLWQVTEELSVGATYKYQPEFTYAAELFATRPVPRTPANFTRPAPFKVPDSIGVGISVNPFENITLNVDANRVYYSELTDELVDFSGLSTQDGAITQAMPDVTEVHVGLEWISLSKPLTLRVGYWLDPYHAPVNNVDDSQLLEGNSTDPELRDVFFLHIFEEDENHYSMGLGWTFGTKFQLDMAVDIGDFSENGTLSGIYRF